MFVIIFGFGKAAHFLKPNNNSRSDVFGKPVMFFLLQIKVVSTFKCMKHEQKVPTVTKPNKNKVCLFCLFLSCPMSGCYLWYIASLSRPGP